jgi:hypothetical protein
MKQALTILLILFISISLYGCLGEETTGTDDGPASQIMFLYAQHDYYYGDEQNEEITKAWGVVLGDPLPEFNYLKLGETMFNTDEYYKYYPGYLYVGLQRTIITDNLNPLNVEVKTSHGQMNGTISLPDEIDTLILSEYDNIQFGESFTISWSGSNADFYNIYFDYTWIDENDYWQWEDIEEFVTEDSYTYEGSNLLYDGEIGYIHVQPINGPFPREGSVGNMSGDGDGFLYYLTDVSEYYGQIDVGSGLPEYAPETASNKHNKSAIRERINKQIENRILGDRELR